MATTTATPRDTSIPKGWQGYLDDFGIAKGRALSPRTLASYHDSFRYLAKFLGDACPDDLADLTKRQVAAWLDFTLTTTSATTTAMRFRGLAAILNFLANPGEDDEPFIAKNPIKGLRPPKPDEQPVKVLSADDMRALLKACKTGTPFESKRDEAILRLLWDTGIRRGELVSMTMTALDLANGTTIVTGKTGPRVIRFEPETGATLHSYLRMRRHRGFGDALWIGHKGAMQGNGVYQVLARRFEQSGVKADHLVHVFRHSFAHHFRSQGGGVDDLVSLAGWSSTTMALRYGKSAAADRARQAHAKFSPSKMLDPKAKRR